MLIANKVVVKPRTELIRKFNHNHHVLVPNTRAPVPCLCGKNIINSTSSLGEALLKLSIKAKFKIPSFFALLLCFLFKFSDSALCKYWYCETRTRRRKKNKVVKVVARNKCFLQIFLIIRFILSTHAFWGSRARLRWKKNHVIIMLRIIYWTCARLGRKALLTIKLSYLTFRYFQI